MARILDYRHQPGYTRLAGVGTAGLEFLEFGVLRVPREQLQHGEQGEREAVFVILSGACEVHLDGGRWEMERVSVFAEPAMAVYVPRHRRWAISASKPAELAVYQAPAEGDFEPRLIVREQVREQHLGAPSFRRRSFTIVGTEFPAGRLLVGETRVQPGAWASYPPHKHDEDRFPEEVRLEEVAYFQVDPPQGFALQYVYTPDRALDEVHVVHNDQAVALARGFHPVAGAPGYSLYYLWGLAGRGRTIRSVVDPAHAWVGEEARELDRAY